MKSIAGSILAGLCLLALALPAHPASPKSGSVESTFEMNTDIPRNDYRTILTDGADAKDCMEQCLQDDQCRAWSFVAAAQPGAKSRCWLKTAAGDRVTRRGIVSGEVTRGAGRTPARRAAATAEPTSTVEVNTNRPGRDYRSFGLSSPRPDRCMETCIGEPRCQAWTFVPPGRQGAQAKCWLKSDVPRSTNSRGMISGVVTRTGGTAAASQPTGPTSTLERQTNRPGGDYRSFALSSPQPEACMEACLGEARCRAWTFVPPGRQGAQAKCWLKGSAPRTVRGAGMVSGMIKGR